MTLMGGPCMSVREEGERRGRQLREELGRGRKELGHTEEKGKRAARWREERELGWATQGKESKKRKREWAGPN
jgi:hypothetical protein